MGLLGHMVVLFLVFKGTSILFSKVAVSIATTGHTPRENHNSKRHMHPNVHCSTIYNSQDTESIWMSINRGMNKEDVVHIYSGILLSHKKEWNWVIFRDMDGPRDCHTEWSKSEREKQISYINAYMWNVEKWYRWTGLQGRNRDTHVENKRMDTKRGKRGGGWWWWDELGNWDWHIHTNMHKIDN